MVYNKNPLKLKISSIRLARGANSPFRLNIDGSPALSLNDVEIAGKDSMYIFVKVTINPNNTNDPLIQSDSILFETNGNLQCVRLVAWGQDAHFYNDVTLKKNTVLTNDKPHVVIKKKLFHLIDFIHTKYPEAKIRACVDSAPVLERAWAVRSGLGWIGKNTNLITKQGSYFFICELITDIELEYDAPFSNDYCGNCSRCMDACPMQAITQPHVRRRYRYGYLYG